MEKKENQTGAECGSSTDYKKKIVEMIGKVENVRFLYRIYIIISDYLKNETD